MVPRKLFLVVFSLYLLSAINTCFARQDSPPVSWSSAKSVVSELTNVPRTTVAAVDRNHLLAQDAQRYSKQKSGPIRVSVAREVTIAPGNNGKWEKVSNQSSLWRHRVECPGATELRLGFSQYHMPEGATLHVMSETSSYYEGAYTEKDNKPHGELWIPVVPGSRATIEVYTPNAVADDIDLELKWVNCGYRDIFNTPSKALFSGEQQLSCNNDVVCSVGDPWREQIDSTALYTVFISTINFAGDGACTGSMVMDTEDSFRNYFLTANHCGQTFLGGPWSANAASVVAYWKFESPVCGQLGGGDLSINQTGATLRANRTDVDMTLLELDEAPPGASNVYFTGWDRSGTAAATAVGIHHPVTGEKAISFNNDPLTTAAGCITGSGVNTHWQVNVWDDGVTEPGSSGSGLWAGSSQRLVGFLSGGTFPTCSGPVTDCYGKFSVAWDGANNSTRLKNWLDPNNSGSMVTDGQRLYPTFQDVARTNIFFADIEKLVGSGITGGCSTAPPLFCPEQVVTRDQMAVFIERGLGNPLAAASGTVFLDVPANYWAAAEIERFAADGITKGCSTNPPFYCPTAAVTRDQMAVFLLRAKNGSGFMPPPATGTMFSDVSTETFAADWIEELASQNITGGCGGGEYCPNDSVTRDQMSAFLARTFNL